MKVILDQSTSRGFFNHGWLQTFHTFSFADYHNPLRMRFGALRVLNDDTVAPGKGFGMHPHNNMEVISIPLQGALRHGDSIENERTITPGDIQVMSTGSGIWHSEYNASRTENLKFLQIWIIPNVRNTPPEYQDYDIRPLLRPNALNTFISPQGGETEAHLRQNAWFTWGIFDAGQQAIYRLNRKNNGVYLLVVEGLVHIQNYDLSERDGIGIWEVDEIDITALAPSRLLLIEVPMD